MDWNATQTELNISAAKKNSVAQFVNMAVLMFITDLFVVNTEEKNYFTKIYGPGGLIFNIVFVFFNNALILISLEAIDPPSLIKNKLV